MTIKKILIANRGEIACRVMRTCRKLGIASVAVYSEADVGALHVESADEAYLIGPAPARESYLDIAKIMDAAKKSGADAVHPGYGFLSENEDFAQACAKAGVVFIGPPPSAIRAMGGKSEAKALMEKAKVPLVPGYHGYKQDEKFLLKEAEKIGFPVLIKASSGGGGKGMRIVDGAKEFSEALAGAKREAKSSFGDDHVLIEKYLKNPRHVEIQVFADTKGNAVYLFERDCSVQRRHQKVIEEAPAPKLSPKTRQKMGESAVAAAKAIKYVGAGTVEFLLDEDESFYFMEMNTRLQVEHPVTEMITGLDLVELQIQVANGEKLPFAQKDLKIKGHAFEARLYAEDPANNFLPGAGKIRFLRFPSTYSLSHDSGGGLGRGGAPDSRLQDNPSPQPSPGGRGGNIRVDTGVREAPYGEGDEISTYYDPMIAKIISFGKNRAAALKNLQEALDQTHVAGPKTNLVFLRALAAHKAFADEKISTRFIENYKKDLLPAKKPANNVTLALAVIGLLQQRERQHFATLERSPDPFSPWFDLASWRVGGGEVESFMFSVLSPYPSPVTREREAPRNGGAGEGGLAVVVEYRGNHSELDISFHDGKKMRASYTPAAHDMGFEVKLNGKEYDAVVLQGEGGVLTVMYDGVHEEMLWRDPLASFVAEDESAAKLTAPMPGRVVVVHAKEGAPVKKGQPLIIVEAMKMEHTIAAPFDGIIDAVNAAVGEQVDEKRELVRFR